MADASAREAFSFLAVSKWTGGRFSRGILNLVKNVQKKIILPWFGKEQDFEESCTTSSGKICSHLGTVPLDILSTPLQMSADIVDQQ